MRRVYSEDLCLMREKEGTSPRSRVYPSEQGHAEDENAVKPKLRPRRQAKQRH